MVNPTRLNPSEPYFLHKEGPRRALGITLLALGILAIIASFGTLVTGVGTLPFGGGLLVAAGAAGFIVSISVFSCAITLLNEDRYGNKPLNK